MAGSATVHLPGRFFSDKRPEILEAFGDGDRTVSHVRVTGTNDGGIAWAGVPANGQAVDTDWIQISRHAEDGMNTEYYGVYDIAGTMTQLGLMPGA